MVYIISINKSILIMLLKLILKLFNGCIKILQLLINMDLIYLQADSRIFCIRKDHLINFELFQSLFTDFPPYGSKEKPYIFDYDEWSLSKVINYCRNYLTYPSYNFTPGTNNTYTDTDVFYLEKLTKTYEVAPDNFIELNISNNLFYTTKDTISKIPYIEGLIKFELEKMGKIFIDRDHEIFSHIIAFLRNPTISLNSIYYSECDFYGVSYPKNKEISNDAILNNTSCDYLQGYFLDMIQNDDLFINYFKNGFMGNFNPTKIDLKHKIVVPYNVKPEYVNQQIISYRIPRKLYFTSLDYVLFEGLDLSIDSIEYVELVIGCSTIERIGYETLKLLLNFDTKMKKLVQYFHHRNLFCLHLPFNFLSKKSFYPFKKAAFHDMYLRIRSNKNVNFGDINPLLCGEYINYIEKNGGQKYMHLYRTFSETVINITYKNHLFENNNKKKNCQGYILKIESSHPDPLNSINIYLSPCKIYPIIYSALESAKTAIRLDLPDLNYKKYNDGNIVYGCYYYFPFCSTFFDYEIEGYILAAKAPITIKFDLNVESGTITLFSQYISFATFTNGMFGLIN